MRKHCGRCVACPFFNFTYRAQFVVVGPKASDVLTGMVIPWCSGCGSSAFFQAVGIIGAVIMPHNLYLHSGLVKVRSECTILVGLGIWIPYVRVRTTNCTTAIFFFARSLVW